MRSVQGGGDLAEDAAFGDGARFVSTGARQNVFEILRVIISGKFKPYQQDNVAGVCVACSRHGMRRRRPPRRNDASETTDGELKCLSMLRNERDFYFFSPSPLIALTFVHW